MWPLGVAALSSFPSGGASLVAQTGHSDSEIL